MSPTSRAIGEAVYCVLSLVPAIGFFVATVTLWRHLCRAAPVQFGITVGLYTFALGGASYSIWRAGTGTAGCRRQLAPRRRIRPSVLHDSWPQMLLPTIAGLLVLAIAPAIVRALAAIDAGLVRYLLAGRPRR